MLTTSARIICRAFRAPPRPTKFQEEKTPFLAQMPQQFAGVADDVFAKGCANSVTASEFPRRRAFGYGAADACTASHCRAARPGDGRDHHPVAARNLEPVCASRMGYRRLLGALVRR